MPPSPHRAAARWPPPAPNIISAPTIRIASKPSRSISTKDSTNSLVADILSATSRSARSSPESRRAWIASISAPEAPAAARPRSVPNPASISLASAALRARTSVSTCSKVNTRRTPLWGAQRHRGIELAPDVVQYHRACRRLPLLPLLRGQDPQERHDLLRRSPIQHAREPGHRCPRAAAEDQLGQVVVGESSLHGEVGKRR